MLTSAAGRGHGPSARPATFVVLANPMESPSLPAFVAAAVAAHPDAHFLCAGDLLNVFPEPGEDHAGSMFYEIFGELLPTELARLQARGFKNPQDSALVGPLHDFFTPGGALYARSLETAARRYRRLFDRLAPALGGRPFYFVPGNMDYPAVAANLLVGHPTIRMLDAQSAAADGLRVGGVGGIPRSAQPLHEVAAISPYELDDGVWEARVEGMAGAAVLITHLSPAESPTLAAFARRPGVRLVVSRAPFDLSRRGGSCRGDSSAEALASGAWLVGVRPFEPRRNEAFVVRLAAGGERRATVETFVWEPPAARAPPARAGCA